jgi:hypothetical protein
MKSSVTQIHASAPAQLDTVLEGSRTVELASGVGARGLDPVLAERYLSLVSETADV